MVIAKTQHLVIREFTTEDIDSLYELYDSWAKGPESVFWKKCVRGWRDFAMIRMRSMKK